MPLGDQAILKNLNQIVFEKCLGSATARARGIFQQKNIRAFREELFDIDFLLDYLILTII